jgi:membrane-associated phospholipid phosphatase
VAVWVTWRVFVTTVRGQTLDDLALAGAPGPDNGALWSLLFPMLDAVSVSLVVVAFIVVVIAAIRRRWTLIIQLLLLIGGANLMTQIVKDHILVRPTITPGWTGSNSLPSGHTTVAASLAAALLIVVPRRWRPTVALLGIAWTVLIGTSTLVGRWHRPSDVVAAVFVALAWGALVCALTGRGSLDVPASPGQSMTSSGSNVIGGLLMGMALVLGGLAGAAMLDLEARNPVSPFSPTATACAGGIIGFTAVTMAAFGLLLFIRQATARPAQLQENLMRCE